MAITKLGDCAGAYHPLASGGPATYLVTAPGIPVNTTVIVMGYNFGQKVVSSVTDARGNTYVVRAGGAYPSIILADSQITTALLSNDKINVNMSGTDSFVAVLAAWFSACYFDGFAQVNITGSAGVPISVAGGPVTTSMAGDLLLGIFGGYNTGALWYPSIQTPGSGYTDQPGIGYTAGAPVLRGVEEEPEVTPLAVGDSGISIDWESKIAGAAGSETATATLTGKASMSPPMAATAAYRESLIVPTGNPISMML